MLRLFDYKEIDLRGLLHELRKENVITDYSLETMYKFDRRHDYQILEWDKTKKIEKYHFGGNAQRFSSLFIIYFF